MTFSITLYHWVLRSLCQQSYYPQGALWIFPSMSTFRDFFSYTTNGFLLSFSFSFSFPGARCCHKAATVSLTPSLSCSLFSSVPLSPLAPAGVVEHESELLISSLPCLTFLSSSSPGQRPWLLMANNDADLKSYFAAFPPSPLAHPHHQASFWPSVPFHSVHEKNI